MGVYSLDLETELLTPTCLFPKPICLSWVDHSSGKSGIVGNNETEPDTPSLESHLGHILCRCAQGVLKLVWHNGFNFDLPVIWRHFPRLRKNLIECLDKGNIHDTLIREKLYDLSTTGRIKYSGYSLKALAKTYLGRDLTKYKEGDDIWRLRYGELDGLPAEQYPKEAREYCIMDVEVLRDVYEAQERIRQEKGYGSMNTEALQIKAGFALAIANERGLRVDKERLDEFEKGIDGKLEPLKDTLISLGFAETSKTGKFLKKNKDFIKYLQDNYEAYVTTTEPTKTHPKGQVRIDEEALATYPPDRVIQCRLDMSLLEKYKGTYCNQIRKSGYVFRGAIGKGGIPKGYDILKETGRTSGFIQTMPREGGVRELFTTIKPDSVLCTIDFAYIEACSMAQIYGEKLGIWGLAEYINGGDKPPDYHAIMGAEWYNKVHGTFLTPESFTFLRSKGDEQAAHFRKISKPPGLSFSGGIGPETLCTMARGQGVDLTMEEAVESLRVAEKAIPGLTDFRGIWYTEHKGWLGKQIPVGRRKGAWKINKEGERYQEWDDLYGYETNGRYRHNCTYCSMANGLSMQSPAADGAKMAIWDCFKYCIEHDGCHLVLFVHDELGFELPKATADEHSRRLALLQCQGMQKMLKKVRISTEYGIMTHWSKDEKNHITKGKVWSDPLKILENSDLR